MWELGQLGVELPSGLRYVAPVTERAEPQEAIACARPFAREI
jgi:hypothetical protein